MSAALDPYDRLCIALENAQTAAEMSVNLVMEHPGYGNDWRLDRLRYLIDRLDEHHRVAKDAANKLEPRAALDKPDGEAQP